MKSEQENQSDRDQYLKIIIKTYGGYFINHFRSKVPIILTSKTQKLLAKPIMFVIDPEKTFLYLTKAIKLKLEWVGIIREKEKDSIFYYINN